MKKRYHLILFFCAFIILNNCSKDVVKSESTYNKLGAILNVTSGAAKIFQDTFYTFNDTLRAMHAVGNFLAQNNVVESAFYISPELIDIKFVNGLSSSICLIETNEIGDHLYRGGSSEAVLKKFSSSGSKNKIKNEKVLVLNPFLDYFKYPDHSYSSILPFFKGGDVDLEVTHVDNKNVTLSHINTMDEYGFVILNTHGTPNSFSLFNLITVTNPWFTSWSPSQIEDMMIQYGDVPISKFENGELKLGTQFLIKKGVAEIVYSISVEITDDYIRNSNLDLTDVVVFGNHCFSGFAHSFQAGDNMVEAWQSKNVATYYGYAFDNLTSIKVNDSFCRSVEVSLIKRLAQENDTTGIAHLSSSNTRQSYNVNVLPKILKLNVNEYKDYQRFRRAVAAGVGNIPVPFYFMKFFSGAYSWRCGMPITDSRDGKTYETVCIGDQVWMAESLNWAGAGVCYDGNPKSCEVYGRLYKWTQVTGGKSSDATPSGVQGICPKGWHVPSIAEWQELINYAGGSGKAGAKLKADSPLWVDSNKSTDEYGFAALPAGECSIEPSKSFYDCFNEDDAVSFWSSSTYGTGASRYISMSGIDYVSELSGREDSRFSCRCVKD